MQPGIMHACESMCALGCRAGCVYTTSVCRCVCVCVCVWGGGQRFNPPEIIVKYMGGGVAMETVSVPWQQGFFFCPCSYLMHQKFLPRR